MLSPKEPWNVKSNLDGSASLQDFYGNTFAVFKDWQAAETLVNHTTTRIKELEERIDALEEDLAAERKAFNEIDTELKGLKLTYKIALS